jgi:hypothetical protein
MTDRQNLELVSVALDRTLDLDDQAELDQLLESSAEAQALKSEFERLEAALESAPEVEPPASLHRQIMEQAKPQPPQHDPSITAWLGQLRPGTGLRYALTASAGALVAAVIIGTTSNFSGTFELSDLAGTMAPGSAHSDQNVVDSFTYQDNIVQLRRGANATYLDIQTSGAGAISVSVDLSDSGFWPDVSAQVEGRPESLTIAGQALQLKSQGEHRLTVLLRRDPNVAHADDAGIRLEFAGEGGLLERAELKATR